MSATLRFLVVAIILVAFGWWLMDLPGTVTVGVGTVTMTAPTSLALLAAVVFVVVLYILFGLLVGLLRLPGRSRRLRRERDRKRGDVAVTRTLLALAGGDPDAARSEAQRGRRLLGDTPQTLLLAAYAARLGGDTEKADEAFDKLAARKDAGFLGLRGLYQGAVARGDWDAATALARQAREVNPNAPWLRAEQERLAIRAGSWKEALLLAGKGTPVAAIGTAAAEQEADATQARRLAHQAWRSDPGFTPAALAYARRLREAGRDKRAQDVYRVSWSKNPHPAIGAAAMEGGGFMSREGRAEWLTAANPTHPESLFLRAQAALDSGNLPQAKRFAESARDAGLGERRVWLLLATIANREDDPAGAADLLRRATTAEPDAHWQCDACGTPQPEWRAVCNQCGEAGRITWGSHASRSGQQNLIGADTGFAILP